jgi:hypothetical protein
LVQQSFTNRAFGLSSDSPNGLIRVPVRPEQVGPEMPHHGLFGRGRNELDNREPVSHDIMIIG